MSVIGLSTLFVFVAQAALAHEKWFVPETPVGIIPSFFRTFAAAPILFVLATLGVVAVFFFLDQRSGQRPRLSRIVAPWLPSIAGVAIGVSLLFAALQRTIFAPNLVIPDGMFGSWIVVLEFVIGLAFIAGLGTRFAATATLLLSLLSVWWFGWNAFDYLNIVGIAFFLFVWGRGAWSTGTMFGTLFFAFDSSPLRPLAALLLRVSLGLTFCLLGFEKLIRPDLHFAALALFPGHNPLAWYQSFLTFLTPEWYLLMSAMVEICAGLLIVLGAFLRPVSAFLLIPFLLYPLFFGAGEIAGHLPIIATLVVLFLFGRHQVVLER